ncbi:HK97 family phage prohead protease [Hymenobacter sp. UYAg731]
MKKPPLNTDEIRFISEGGVQFRAVADAAGPMAFIGQAIVCGKRSKNLGGFVEIIDPKALDEADLSDVKGLFNHNRDYVLGTTGGGTLTLTRSADGGLSYEIPYDAEDPDHVRVMRKIMRGDVVGSSFAFRVASNGDTWEHEQTDETDIYVRTITDIEVVKDVCPVTDPAYADSSTAHRSLEQFKQAHPEAPAEERAATVPLSVRRRQLELLAF